MKTAKFLMISAALVLLAAAFCSAAEEVNPQWWGKAPGQRPVMQGVVANVSPTNIAVQTPKGVRPFVVNEKTKVMVGGKKATIADVKVGNPVVVRFQLQGNNVPLAIGVVVPKPMVRGVIVAIQGNVITVRDGAKQERPNAAAAPRAARPNVGNRRGTHSAAAGAQPAAGTAPAPGVDRRIVVTENTKFDSHGYKGSLNDLRIGYHVTANGAVNGEEFVANAIEFVPAVAKGTVTGIENGVITVKTVRQLTIPVQASEATVVWVKPRVAADKRGTMEDVKVGSPVNIAFHPVQNGAAPLLWVAVFTGM